MVQNHRYLGGIEFEFFGEVKYLHVEGEPVNFGSGEDFFSRFRGKRF